MRSKPRSENIAFDNLIKQNYTVYSPRVKILNKIQFLFPGYLFVYLDKENDNWSPICSTKGVANFVRFGLEFAKVNDKIISFIKDKEKQTADKVIDLSKFHTGDKLKIKDGIFKNQEAIFQEYNGEKRVIVLMNMIGKTQKIKLYSKQIEGL